MSQSLGNLLVEFCKGYTSISHNNSAGFQEMCQALVASLEASPVNCVGGGNQVFGYVDSLVQEQNREVVTNAAGWRSFSSGSGNLLCAQVYVYPRRTDR